MLEQARQLFLNGRLAETEVLCRRVIDSHPSHSDAFNILGQTALKMGRYADATDCFERALALRPDVAYLHLLRARALRLAGQGDDAIAGFRLATLLAPTLAEAHANLGMALAGAKRLDEATDGLRQALALMPGHGEVMLNLAIVLQLRQRDDEAMELYRQSIVVRPASLEAHANLGSLLSARSRHEEAITCYERAIALAPDRSEIHSNLAQVLFKLDRAEEALTASRHAVALEPEKPEVLLGLGQLLLQMDRPADAELWLRRTLAVAPANRRAQASLGRAIHAQGRIDTHVLTRLGEALSGPDDDATKFISVLVRSVSYAAEILTREFMATYGTRIPTGPFAGMDYRSDGVEGCHLPKLVGCYESALHPHIAAAAGRGYQAVVNIGSADGYYAVGLARLLPDTHVHAYDIDHRTHPSCRKLAQINGVGDRITIGGRFAGEDFADFADRRTLVLCDIEGGELELLDPGRYPALAGMDIMVELHDCYGTPMSRIVTGRFAATHDITLLDSGIRSVALPGFLAHRSSLEQFLAIWEARPGATPWAVLIARAPAPSR